MKTLEDFRQELQEIESRLEALDKEKSELEAKRRQKIIERLVKSNILSQLQWSFSEPQYLELIEPSTDEERNAKKELDGATWTSYHCRDGLEDGVYIRHGDGEVSLYFDTFERLLTFVRTQNIQNIRFDSLEEEQRRSQRKSQDLIVKIQGLRNTFNTM